MKVIKRIQDGFTMIRPTRVWLIIVLLGLGRWLGVSGMEAEAASDSLTALSEQPLLEETSTPLLPAFPALVIENQAQPSEVDEPGANVEFQLKIVNKDILPLQLQAITFNIFGDISKLVDNCTLPISLKPGEEWLGKFSVDIKGAAGQNLENVVSIMAADVNGKEYQFQAKAIVSIRTSGDSVDQLPLLKSAAVGGRVWEDLNHDGLQSAGEPGLSGVSLQLVAYPDNTVLAATQSGADGTYGFSGNFPTQVYLQVKQPVNFTFTLCRVGVHRSQDSDIDPATGKSAIIDLNLLEGDGDRVSLNNACDVGLVTALRESRLAGVRGPVFWKRHLNAWPKNEIIVGGKTYTREEAARLLTNGSDKSYTIFRSLVTVILNIEAGAPAGCIEDVLRKSQEWVAAHPPGSRIGSHSEAWQDQGWTLNKNLEDYNEGRLCAPAHPDCKEPISVRSGMIVKENGKATQLQVRVSAEKGRTLILQKSSDLKTWFDVEVLDNLYGMSDSLRTEVSTDPITFYRIVFPSGPSEAPKDPAALDPTFRQVDHNENIQLLPVIYKGNLVILGNENGIAGTMVTATSYTVIAGDLIIKGDYNTVSQLTVLGKVIIQGNSNQLEQVDYQGGIEEAKGSKENEY